MTEVIACLALVISVLLLILQYRDRVERRHGDIARLRGDALSKLSAIQQRFTAAEMHMETARIELRRAKDCDDKYDFIEAMPSLMQGIKEDAGKVEELKDRLDRLDTTKANRSSVLILLQSAEHRWQALEDVVSQFEHHALDLLKHIRSDLEAEDKPSDSGTMC